MSDLVKANFKQFGDALKDLSKGGGLDRRIGIQLRDALEEEFLTLLLETPQWSGTTVASYNFGLRPGDEVREQPEPADITEALQRGHLSAVQVAMHANTGKLPLDFKGYRTNADLALVNAAPGFETAEEGPVRDVNNPVGAVARFVERVNELVIDIDFDGDL